MLYPLKSSVAGARSRHAMVAACFFIGALLLLLPVLAVLASLFAGTGQTQAHIWSTNGVQWLLGTIGLCAIVAVLAGTLGVVTAGLVSLTDLPARRWISAALALPFAVPAYILAYVISDVTGPFGFIAMLGGGDVAAFLSSMLRTQFGAACVLSLTVYPYVFLAVRADFLSRSGAYVEAGAMLGRSRIAIFTTILVPAARAAFLGGLALALMETAADFGVSDYLGIQTLSTGIFRTWYGFGDLLAASQIAGGLFIVAALFLVLEEASRAGQRSEHVRAHRAAPLFALSRGSKFLGVLICVVPVLLGFVVPVLVLTSMVIETASLARFTLPMTIFGNTVLVAGIGAFLAMCLAGGLAIANRWVRSKFFAVATRLITIGYAIPGGVIAVGILLAGQKLLAPIGITVTSGGLFVLIYAYIVRFLTAGYNNVHGGFSQINPLVDAAARTLGAGIWRTGARIHLPMTRMAFAAGAMIVFVDIVRELPATLLLRPFNFETLATQVYRLASDERLAQAAPACLLLILTGLVPVILISLFSDRKSAA